MKKTALLLVFVICLALICSCTDNNGESGSKDSPENVQATADESTAVNTETEKPGPSFDTPFCTLRFPAEYENHVECRVASEDPYTLSFVSSDDGTKLFSFCFDGGGDFVLGTLVGEEKNTVIYVTLPELDKTGDRYEEYCGYIERTAAISDNLSHDYDFAEGIEIEKEDESVFDIETPIVTLKYPQKWKEKVNIDVSENRAAFSYGDVRLFDIVFSEGEGYSLGTYRDTPVYFVEYHVETDEEASMQEDVNVILRYLENDPDFISD